MIRRPALLSFALLLVISGCAGTSATREPSYPVSKLQDMGEKYMSAGDTASALKFLTEAEQKKPNDPVIQYDLGLAYDQRGLPDQALLHFQNALKINPGYPEAMNAIGSIYAKRGQVELAQQTFQKAMDDPFYKTPQIAAYNLG
ncbi:MAG: tetratricopeptide repeat protein, partial [Syntrophobacteraceae bacterium]